MLGTSVVAWLSLVAPSARAGGYMYADSGIVASGRGGAVVAGADDQFAQYYNPAALVRMDRPTLNLGLSGVTQNVTFTAVDEAGVAQAPVSNEAPPFAVPQLGFASPIVPGKVAFAFGFTSPFAPGFTYDPDGAQRYSMIDTLIWNFQIGPSIAVRPIEQIAIGASFQWQVLRVEELLKVTTSGSTDPGGDVLVEAKVNDLFTPSFNAGVLVEPVGEVLAIGLSVQPPVKFVARGSGTLDFTGNGLENILDQAVWVDDDVGLEISLPLVLRGGVSVRPTNELELEVDVVHEGWKSLKDLKVTDINITVTGEALGLEQPVDETLSLPAGFQSTTSVRFGAEYDVAEPVAVRAGGFWESASLRPQQVSVTLPDTPKVGLSAGGSAWIAKHLKVDAFFAYVLYKDLVITDSEVEQINVYGEGAAITGNGALDVDGWTAGGQLSYAFGKPKG